MTSTDPGLRAGTGIEHEAESSADPGLRAGAEIEHEAEAGADPGVTTGSGPGLVTRVLLVDDQDLLRRSLAVIIEHEPDLTVVGQAGDGVEALVQARATRPDVVLMDVRMPRLDGLEATRRICADPVLSACRVLVLSMFELDEYVYEALRAGASGFLLKDARPEELADAVRRTHRGESLFAPSILTRLVAHYVAAPRPERGAGALRHLTRREVDVLALIGSGLSNDEVADALNISIKTVKSHISHLLAKLRARDRAQLVIAAFNAGLVRPHTDQADKRIEGRPENRAKGRAENQARGGQHFIQAT
ncbi:DNA-binding NarL/FixJ family response regulator [Actinoplanes lutulentus]|uniref:LuxR family two component transcriptional regulator n=1 Tax=Actinoplanes lutulentus TaxID=1287878 RepID=A0A327ZML7_9ACTN|nr:DNA-binding NarL/FixJ family response regulator [Actinoplanes lutulentus]RAK42284.1 LuxR family two component transcriptional regulator [Actinoplanes lutulentus]